MKDLIKRVLAVICAVGVMSAYTGIIASAAPTPRPMPGTEAAANTQNDSQDDSGQDDSSYGVSAIDEARVRTTSSSTASYVASSETGADDEDGSQESEPEQDGSVQAPTLIPVNSGDYNEAAPQAPQEETPAKQRGGVSMGAVFLWFLAAVIINAIVSFWVGNRFYKLAKKDTHVTAEIRALRRDVEEKFISNVGGFTEMENEISNSNEDYSMNDDGIKMPERKAREPRGAVVNDGFEEDAFRRWESLQAEEAREQTEQPRNPVEQTQRISTSSIRTRREEPERELRKKQYQPSRKSEYNKSINGDYGDEDIRIGKRTEKKANQNVSAVKNKAKEFLGDIFPFKED